MAQRDARVAAMQARGEQVSALDWELPRLRCACGQWCLSTTCSQASVCLHCQTRQDAHREALARLDDRERAFRFDRLDIDADSADAIVATQAWAWNIRKGVQKTNLVLYGPRGTGKTTLLKCARNELLLPDDGDCYTRGVEEVKDLEFFDECLGFIEARDKAGELRLINRLKHCGVLLWDEMGLQPRRDGALVDKRLFRIFDYRWERGYPTAIAMNANPAQKGVLEERVGSRILAGIEPILVGGDDRRRAR